MRDRKDELFSFFTTIVQIHALRSSFRGRPVASDSDLNSMEKAPVKRFIQSYESREQLEHDLNRILNGKALRCLVTTDESFIDVERKMFIKDITSEVFNHH